MTEATPDQPELPETLPIFPLSGFLIFPGGESQLNIFEPRYLAMVEDALASHRMIGMIQPRENGNQGRGEVYDIGCCALIEEMQPTPDGRMLIWIRGLSRFRIVEELKGLRGYRRVRACWDDFPADPEQAAHPDRSDDDGVDRNGFIDTLAKYAGENGMELNRPVLDAAPLRRVVHAVAGACDLSVAEKQAILEADGLRDQTSLIQAMLELAMHRNGNGGEGHIGSA